MTTAFQQIRRNTGLLLGPLLALLLLSLPAPEGLSEAGMRVAAVTAWMAVWWISEAIPIPATALLPVVLFPLLGVMKTQQVTLAYGNHLIFLFMGGFMIAVTMEKWQLHRRIALHTIRLVGISSRRLVLGFMIATAFLSMWISNTATAMMMLTIGLAIIRQTQDSDDDFAPALMLGIAYAASIGGVATLIGTPPNAILAGVVEKNHGIVVSFADWMLFALPLSLIMLACTWIYLTRGIRGDSALQGGMETIDRQLQVLGPIRRQEQAVLLVFAGVAVAWILRGLLDIEALSMVSDSSIAIAGALLLFIIPADLKQGEFLLDWRTAVTIPWDIIILFGGGFAIAAGFGSSGLSEWIATRLGVLEGTHLLVLIGSISLVVVFLTEVTSNTATASLLIPVMGALALSMDLDPMLTMSAAAIAASYAFMLPVATPPNAIVFASRRITMAQMAATGLFLNLLGCLLITLFVSWLLPLVFQQGSL